MAMEALKRKLGAFVKVGEWGKEMIMTDAPSTKTRSQGTGLLIGCGRMGQRHLKHLSSNPKIGNFHLVDAQHPDLSSLPGRQAGYFRSLEAALETSPSWAIVAVSTPAHYEVAVPLLERGIAVLMEKPLAPTTTQCAELLKIAERHRSPLYVGHVERFNPVVFALGKFLKSGVAGKVHTLHLTRWGAAPAEVLPGNNVVVDLTVHDIDILHSFGYTPKLLSAQMLFKESHVDHVEAILDLGASTSSVISTSWRSSVRKRAIRVLSEHGAIEANLLTQSLSWEGAPLELPHVVPTEPLEAQLEAFLSAIDGQPSLSCSGAEGARAVGFTESILSCNLPQ
jgi:UDP-N-acetylglucosamine 3-dehydrogenase